MKRGIFITGLIICLLLTGCQMDRTKTDEDKIAEELNPARNKQEKYDPELDKRLGYVNYTQDQFDGKTVNEQNITIDRNELADAIARIILSQNGFEEIATLVTDKEVLIAYDTEDKLDANKAANIAKKATMSIVPRFFDVYVTDNTSLIPDIQSLHNSKTNNSNYDNTLERIISEMKESPQGD